MYNYTMYFFTKVVYSSTNYYISMTAVPIVLPYMVITSLIQVASQVAIFTISNDCSI